VTETLNQPASRNGQGPGANSPTAEAEAALMRWIDRMDALVAAETKVLLAGEKVDFDAFNSKKNHALLEFMILSRGVGEVSPVLLAALRRLNERLTKNGEVLKQNLQAASEISKLIISVIRAEESDGTYSRRTSLRANERLG
jgi:predicted hydrolase (HD superfamily)